MNAAPDVALLFLKFVFLTATSALALNEDADVMISVALPGSNQSSTKRGSAYMYYGPQHPQVEARSLFLSLEDLCNPKRSAVENMIVVSDRKFDLSKPPAMGCFLEHRLEHVYEKLNAAGATAYIDLTPWYPGLFAHRSHKWDQAWGSKTYRSGMIVVNAFSECSMIRANNFGGRSSCENISEKWNGLDIKISSQRDTPPCSWCFSSRSMSAVFASIPWIIVMRVGIPLCAFFTSGVGVSILLRRPKCSTAAKFISWVEVPCTTIIGAFLVLGHYGPYRLPIHWHMALMNLLIGSCLFCSLVLSLYLRETTEFIINFNPQRSIWKKYKKNLIFAIASLGVLHIWPAFDIDPSLVTVTILLSHLLFLVAQICSSAFFIASAFKWRGPIRLFLYRRRIVRPDTRNDAHHQHLGSMMLWIGVVGGFMVLNLSAFSVFLILFFSNPLKLGPWTALMCASIFSFSRLGIAFSMMRSTCFQRTFFLRTGIGCARKVASIIPRAVIGISRLISRNGHPQSMSRLEEYGSRDAVEILRAHDDTSLQDDDLAIQSSGFERIYIPNIFSIASSPSSGGSFSGTFSEASSNYT